MASGYEKADCGAAPGADWGNPSHIENTILLVVGIAGAVAFFATKAALAMHIVSWLVG